MDDDTYRRARITAAERDTSVSALVKAFLSTLAGESEFERLRRLELRLREQIPQNFRASDRLPRAELYNRKA
ncbi:MAG TPA: hypothetical protein VIJ42_09165 [Stellaceae bacterium]